MMHREWCSSGVARRERIRYGGSEPVKRLAIEDELKRMRVSSTFARQIVPVVLRFYFRTRAIFDRSGFEVAEISVRLARTEVRIFDLTNCCPTTRAIGPPQLNLCKLSDVVRICD